MPPGRRNTAEDLWIRATNGDGCWEWLGTRSESRDGIYYGKFHLDGQRWLAHRLAYVLAVGSIPEGLVIDHLCRNTLCIRPSHLEAVDNRTNVISRGHGSFADKARQTHCKRGHEFTPENTMPRKDGTRDCRACHNARRAGRLAAGTVLDVND